MQDQTDRADQPISDDERKRAPPARPKHEQKTERADAAEQSPPKATTQRAQPQNHLSCNEAGKATSCGFTEQANRREAHKEKENIPKQKKSELLCGD